MLGAPRPGAGICACLLLLASALLGVGTVGGALYHKGLKLTYENKALIVSELQRGKTAIGILAKFSETGIIQDRLTSLGGKGQCCRSWCRRSLEVGAGGRSGISR